VFWGDGRYTFHLAESHKSGRKDGKPDTGLARHSPYKKLPLHRKLFSADKQIICPMKVHACPILSLGAWTIFGTIKSLRIATKATWQRW
jgi:hypothetical protein